METRFVEDIRHNDEKDFGVCLRTVEKAVLSDDFWDMNLVQEPNTSNGNHPAFRTFLASQAKENVRGFLSKDVTVSSMLKHRGDVHHIFPRDYLKNQLGLKQSQYNQVANYIYAQQEINIAIGNSSPHEYMKQVQEQCSGGERTFGNIHDIEDLRMNLRECAISHEFLDGKLYEYEGFLTARRQFIAKKLKRYYFSL